MAKVANDVDLPNLKSEKSQKIFRILFPSTNENFEETNFAI